MQFHKQETNWTCGAAAMRMALEACGIKRTEKQVVRLLKTNKVRGTYIRSFPQVAEKFNLDYVVRRNADISDLKRYQKEGYVIVLSYYYPPEKVDHYVALNRICSDHIHFYDPWYGPKHKYSIKHFMRVWKCDPKYDKDKRWFIAIKRP